LVEKSGQNGNRGPDEYDVFISYSRKDAIAVDLLASHLSNESGLRVWIDKSRLRPGVGWRGEIETAMNASAGALIVWGPQGLGPVQRQERDLSYSIRDVRQDFKVIYCLLPNSPPPQGNWANVDTWIQFDGGLDDADAIARLVAAIRGQAPPSGLTSQLPDEPAPYRGLAAFGVEDARFFFGRKEYTEEILERLKHYPFVALVGASGSGKTSLVQAGLRPVLTNGNGAWQWLLFNPGPQPLRSMARALARLQPQTDPLALTDSILQRLLTKQTPLAEIIQSYLPEQTSLMLVIDRLEEIFTLCEAEDERQSFLETLVTLFHLPHQPAKVVATMRADFYSHVGRYPNLANEVVNHQVYLMPMAQQNVAEIIGAPATQVGAIFEKGLAKRVDDDANAGGEIVLPLLQQTLDLLWRKRRGRWFTWDAYEEIGGVAGALRYHAGRVIDSLNPEEQKIARRLFMRLIWLDEQTGTMAGRRVEKSALIEENSDERVLQRLADERLVILRGQGELATVSLVHDTLPLHWERLREWMQEDREFLLGRQRLLAALTEWNRANRDEGALMRGALLDLAGNWLATRSDDLNPNEEKFIGESLALRKRERLARETRQRRIILGLAGGILIAVLLSVVALVQRARARHASQEAVSNKLAALATLYSTDRLDLALLLSSEAKRAGSTQDARRIFLGGLIDSPHLQAFLHGHSGWVSSVAFSPDGKTLASCSDDKTIILWDVATRSLIERLKGHTDEVLSVAFSPDGKLLASGSKDGNIILWDVHEHKQLGDPLRSHGPEVEGAVLTVAFSLDGKILASGGDDKTIVLWNVATRKPIGPSIPQQQEAVVNVVFSPDAKTLAAGVGGNVLLLDITNPSAIGSLTTNSKGINSLAFSPDGERLLVGSDDKFVMLWDLATKTLIKVFAGHSDVVQGVAFSPDGNVLASGSMDNTVILWDVRSGEQLDPPFRVHADGVTSVAFSPDGRTLASASRDNKVILWNVVEHEHVLKGHDDKVWAVTFSPDGKMLASGGENASVILWDLEKGTSQHLEGHSRIVTGLAFSPDGKILASSSRDAKVILYQLGGDVLQPLILNCEKEVFSVAFSPDGKTLVAGLDDGEIIVWDAATHQQRSSIKGGHWPWALAFSPDGKILAAGDQNGTITLWDVATGKSTGALVGRKERVLSVVFSSDGKIVASSSLDKSIVLWDVEHRVPLSIPLTGHTDVVLAVAFSPDGKTLASGSNDDTIILWDVASRRRIGRPLVRHTDQVKALAFSPDGKTLATGSADHTIVLWDINLEFDSTRGCRIANRNLSKAEWDQFIGPDTPYECTCPDLPCP
jgi:WD40 repeat protein